MAISSLVNHAAAGQDFSPAASSDPSLFLRGLDDDLCNLARPRDERNMARVDLLFAVDLYYLGIEKTVTTAISSLDFSRRKRRGPAAWIYLALWLDYRL